MKVVNSELNMKSVESQGTPPGTGIWVVALFGRFTLEQDNGRARPLYLGRNYPGSHIVKPLHNGITIVINIVIRSQLTWRLKRGEGNDKRRLKYRHRD